MTDVLPRSMVRVKRGLCPRCGLPLPLEENVPSLTCAACGCTAVLERRVRTTEPELPGAPLRLEPDDDIPAETPRSGRWLRSRQFRQGDVDGPTCPGCGMTMVIDGTAGSVEVIRCDTCGTDARYERRLVAVRPTEPPPQPQPRRPDEPAQLDDTAEDDPGSEHLMWRLLYEPDPDRRLALALNLRRWRYVNRTVARFVPALLASLHRAGRTGDERFEQAVADGLSLLSNHCDTVLRDAVLVAAEPWMFRPGTSRALVTALGLGAPVGLKLLLDSAEWSHTRVQADDTHAAACLHAVNWLFQRNVEAHATMGEVLLYRMLYLSGPTLAFALGVAQRRITGTGFHFDASTLLRFIDDAAVERPVLVPDLERAIYTGRPRDGAHLMTLMATFRSLRSPASRAAALRHVLAWPESDDTGAGDELVTLAADVLDDPDLGRAAGECLTRIVREAPEIPSSLHALVERRRDHLPSELRRNYLATVPQTPHLDPAAIPYWTSPAPVFDSAEMAAAMERWKAGLDALIDDETRRREALAGFWSARAGSPEAAAADVWTG